MCNLIALRQLPRPLTCGEAPLIHYSLEILHIPHIRASQLELWVLLLAMIQMVISLKCVSAFPLELKLTFHVKILGYLRIYGNESLA